MDMEARHEYFRNTTCPACNLLPLDVLSKNEAPPPSSIRLEDLSHTELERFAQKCDLCHLLLDLYGHWLPGQKVAPIPYDGTTYRALCGRNEWRIRYTEQSHLSLFTDFDSPLSKRVDDRFIHEDPLSDCTVRLIKHWMTKCERKHHACFDHQQVLPTRVIDVTGSTLKLVDPSPSGSHQYIALSHCWGSCRSFLTTRDNVGDRRQGFPIEQLPTTFQDAVKVTRHLGIPYLWIDSICILQGDKDDWESEGSKMADVYSNATLTIAAANASDDAEGFLKPRVQPPTLAINIYRESSINDSDQCIRVYTRLPPKTELIYEPLDGRAWCLQERYLSPRILFFTSDSLRWECLGDGWFETGRGFLKNKLMLPDVMPKILKNGELSHIPWYKMVELYSTRGITYASDKLPAVSALASRVGLKSKDKYLAGLWNLDLFQGLLWYRQVRRRFRTNEPTAPFEDANHRRKNVAPSWSWSSFPGAVQFEAVVLEEKTSQILPTVSLIDASALATGKNPFGEVESGILSLRAQLLSFEPAEQVEQSIGAWEHNVLWCLEVMDFDVDVGSTLDYPDTDEECRMFGVPLIYSKHQENHTEEDMETGRGNELNPWVEAHGILLRAKERDTFQRVGCFKIGPIQWHDLLVALNNTGDRTVKIV